MLPQEIIRRKRDGKRLEDSEIAAFIGGMMSGAVTGEQVAAFAMAVFLRGMDPSEIVALTEAMTVSGRMLDWSGLNLPGPVLDKHSTGGVGDNVSLMLAPLVAACGAFVPMISGRGLGHSGGTLDKLESIPGYRVAPDLPLFRSVVREVGCAIIGQTSDLAPADGQLYAIRDVTATVESIPLITASILSKKRAAGLAGLVMDVKTGSGAFMTELSTARTLAETIVAVSNGAGLPCTALITDMNEPLASAAGNALEVRNAIDYLTGARRDARLHAVVLALGAEMLVLGGLAPDTGAAETRLRAALDDGSATEHFARMVAALGGPHDLVERPDTRLLDAPVWREVTSEVPGVVKRIDTRALGLAVVALGGGRTRPGDAVDPRVGFDRLAPIGAAVPGQPLGIVHAATEEQAEAAAEALQGAYRIGTEAPRPSPPIIERLAPEPTHANEPPVLVVALKDEQDPGAWIEAFRSRLPSYRIVSLDDVKPGEPVRYVAAWRHPHGRLARFTNLTALFSLGAGVDHLMADPGLPPGVPVVRVVDPDLTSRMSEWVMLHVLAYHRQQRLYDWQQFEKIWEDDAFQPAAKDVRVGLLGLGVLGQDAARKLKMMGFDVAGWSRTAKAVPDIETFAGEAGLDPFLNRTQILVCLLPLTPATRGMLNRGLFGELARDSYFGGPFVINAGRGGLQVEADILTALEDGILRGVTLDVFETEPLPKTSELWHHPGVTLTPHNAAISNPDAIAGFIADQITSHDAGAPLAHVVDRSTHY